MFSPYLGMLYNNESINQAIGNNQHYINTKICQDPCETAARSIADGKIIAWFQGRAECGPRALGNRSILATPCDKDMKDIINKRIKFREAFRPFAPSVLSEYQEDYFLLDVPSPYMLMVADVVEKKKALIPAVIHIDGTARLQTVIKSLNPIYYRLIESFYKLSGVPIVLNTSFNVNKKPIVETPADAIRCFLETDLDELYIHQYRITKKQHGF